MAQQNQQDDRGQAAQKQSGQVMQPAEEEIKKHGDQLQRTVDGASGQTDAAQEKAPRRLNE